jgi:hypothetical protein
LNEGLPSSVSATRARTFDGAIVVAWWAERRFRKRIGAIERAVRTELRDECAELRLRRLEARTRLLELTLAERKGELVPIDQIESLRAALRALPMRYALRLEACGVLPFFAEGLLREIAEDVVRLLASSGTPTRVRWRRRRVHRRRRSSSRRMSMHV